MVTNLILGDSLEVLKDYPENSFDSVVTDPPYGISFLNSHWDYDVPSVEFWQEVLRVLKPGGHILVFCGTRTQHRMVVNIEDAGFEIRDVITWLYGQGFPKSYNIAKGIQGLETIGSSNWSDWKEMDGELYDRKTGYTDLDTRNGYKDDYSSAESKDIKLTTENALKWKGWGTALKPACEFITLARKPISEKSVVKNVLKWGTGGLNIDSTRIELNGEIVPINKLEDWSGFGQLERPEYTPTQNTQGRWPANLILDEEAGKLLDEQTGESKSKYSPPKARARERHFEVKGKNAGQSNAPDNYGDSGGASRFFYCAKPSKAEKNRGLEELPFERHSDRKKTDGAGGKNPRNRTNTPKQNFHPTVKPIALMKYLVKLITPIHGNCLDPFLGSGTTAIACKELNIDCTGVEREEKYLEIAQKRIDNWK